MKSVVPLPEPSPAARLSIWRVAPVAAIAIAVLLAYAMGWHEYLTLQTLAESRMMIKEVVGRHPLLAPLAYFAGYAILVAFSVPASAILTVFSGFLFGWRLGGAIAVCASTVGAAAVFLIARSAFGGLLTSRAGGLAARLADGFRKDAFLFILVLRVAPFVPFALVNIAAALLGVKVRVFVAATAFGIVPIVFAYAWLGQGIDSVLMTARRAGREATIADLVTPEIATAFLALAGVGVVAVLAKKFWFARA